MLHNSLVFAGTWTRTFTRITSMEAACESARHAVNAILDHYVWVGTGGADRREITALEWRIPFGFLDQGFSSPVRLPSPAGDYCFVFDIENREPLDALPLRNLDSQFFRASLPHPLDTPGGGPLGGLGTTVPPITAGGSAMTSSDDYTGQLLTYLQAWRQYLERATGAASPSPASPAGVAAPAWPNPPVPNPPVPTPPVPPPPASPVPAAAVPSGLITPWPPPMAPAPAASPPPAHPTASGNAGHPAVPVPSDPPPATPRGSLYSAALSAPSAGSAGPRKPRSAYRWVPEPTDADPPVGRSLYTNPAPDRRPAGSAPVPDQLRGLEEVELIGSDPRI